MDFAALPQSLDSFLDSLIPALSHCVFLVLFLWFMVGGEALAAPLRRLAARMRAPDALTEDPFVKESGLLKLVPFALLVVTLLGVVAIDRTVLFVGDRLPGRISIRQPDILAKSVNPQALAQLWSMHAGAADLAALHQMLDYQAANMAPPSGRNLQLPWVRHDADFASARNQFEAAKFYALLGLVLCLAHRRLGVPAGRLWSRYAVVLVGATLFAAWSVQQHVRAKKMSERAKVVYVLNARVVSDPAAAATVNDAAKQAAYLEKVKAATPSSRAYSIEP